VDRRVIFKEVGATEEELGDELSIRE